MGDPISLFTVAINADLLTIIARIGSLNHC